MDNDFVKDFLFWGANETGLVRRDLCRARPFGFRDQPPRQPGLGLTTTGEEEGSGCEEAEGGGLGDDDGEGLDAVVGV